MANQDTNNHAMTSPKARAIQAQAQAQLLAAYLPSPHEAQVGWDADKRKAWEDKIRKSPRSVLTALVKLITHRFHLYREVPRALDDLLSLGTPNTSISSVYVSHILATADLENVCLLLRHDYTLWPSVTTGSSWNRRNLQLPSALQSGLDDCCEALLVLRWRLRFGPEDRRLEACFAPGVLVATRRLVRRWMTDVGAGSRPLSNNRRVWFLVLRYL